MTRSPSKKVQTIRICREIFFGGLGGLAASLVFGYLGASTIGPGNGEDPHLMGAVSGMIAGSTIGSSLGVYATGKASQARGSYWATLLGSTVGTLLFLALSPDLDYASFWVELYALPSLGGTAGFNASRVNKAYPDSGRGIINIDNGSQRLLYMIFISSLMPLLMEFLFKM